MVYTDPFRDRRIVSYYYNEVPVKTAVDAGLLLVNLKQTPVQNNKNLKIIS